jgi:hypothetical protein
MTFAVFQSPSASVRRALRFRLARGLALPLVLMVALFIVPAARADVGATIIERCTHGQSLSGFSQQDYRRALQELPAEVEEYSDCANLIRRAQLQGARGGSGAEGLAPIVGTAGERSALRGATKTGAAPVSIGGKLVRPGLVQASFSSALSTLPAPLLAILAFLLACALALAGRSIRNRVRAHRSA